MLFISLMSRGECSRNEEDGRRPAVMLNDHVSLQGVYDPEEGKYPLN